MEGTRDVVVIVTGIVWSILFLAVLIVVLVAFVLIRSYLNKAHAFMHETAAPFIANVQAQADALQVRTARLPGHPPVLAAPPQRTLPSGFSLSLPFLRRRKPWWQRLLRR